MKHSKLLYLLTFYLLGSTNLQAQFAEGCDGIRYASTQFTSISKITVEYATAIPENQQLSVDIYQPIGDVVQKRPMIILAHGGAFFAGDKADMQALCESFASRGFVTASVQYRLFTGFPSKEIFQSTTVKAISDMKGVYRFFKNDAATTNLYHIDTTKMMIGGISAGAITALHMAYLDENDVVAPELLSIINKNGGFRGNTGSADNLKHSTSDIFGVINLSGAMVSNDLLDEGEPMLMSMHGDKDDVVPIDSANVFGLIYMYGSRYLTSEANRKNIPNILEVVPGGGHTNIYTDPIFLSNVANFNQEAIELYYPRLCGFKAAVHSTNQENLVGNVWPTLTSSELNLEFTRTVNDLIIYNAAGEFISKYKINSDHYKLNCYSLTPGMYYAIPQAGGKYFKAISFIKR